MGLTIESRIGKKRTIYLPKAVVDEARLRVSNSCSKVGHTWISIVGFI